MMKSIRYSPFEYEVTSQPGQRIYVTGGDGPILIATVPVQTEDLTDVGAGSLVELPGARKTEQELACPGSHRNRVALPLRRARPASP